MNDNHIATYIERLANLLRNEMRSSGNRVGLQPTQLDALQYLSSCNRFSDTPMGVTEFLGQTKGTVSQSLKVLEREGLVEKQVDADDKRVTHLKVTASGKKVLHQMYPAKKFAEGCAALPEAEQSQLVELLKSLLNGIQRANGYKSFGVCATCRFNRKIDDKNYHCELVDTPLTAKDVTLICREHSSI